jgi:hypothetical protein
VSGSSDEFQLNLFAFDGAVDFCEAAQAVDPATSARYCFEWNPPFDKKYLATGIAKPKVKHGPHRLLRYFEIERPHP